MIVRRLLFAFLILSSAPFAKAQFYNVDFGSFNGAPASTFGASASQPGVWNNVTSSGPTALVDTSGAATAAQISVSAGIFGGSSVSPFTGDLDLLLNDNFFTVSSGPWSFVITGLTNGIYSLFYYAPPSTIVSTGSFTVNGVFAPDLTGSNSGSGTVQGVDWQVIHGIPVTTGTMTSTFGSATQSINGLSGMQLVVPEPSTGLLLASALAGFALRRRRTATGR